MQQMEAVHSPVHRTVLRMKVEKVEHQDKQNKLEQNKDQAAEHGGTTTDKRGRVEDRNQATEERTMPQKERGEAAEGKAMEGKKKAALE